MQAAVDLLARLVGFDTTSSKSNLACIQFIADYLSNHNIKAEIIKNPDGNKACLWASIGPADGEGLVLSGHTDVVPVAGQQWSSDPFTLTERDGKFYGRGSCDMKAFIACALAVVPDYAKRKLTRPIQLAFTYDEETGMDGAAQLVPYLKARNVKPYWVWIGEPTLHSVIHAHKGVAAYITSFKGIPGHSAMPDKGLSAITMGNSFMNIIEEVANKKRSQPMANSPYNPPYTTFNLAIAKGGTAENIIAEHFELTWQTRCHPGEQMGPILAEIEAASEQRLGPQLARFPGQASIKTCTCFDIPPMQRTAENPGEKILLRLTNSGPANVVSFATEAGFFQQLGTHVIVCGPGSIEQAHKADEFVARSEIEKNCNLIRRVLDETVLG